jgi:DNA-binding MarR family transcriptional regulator
MPVGDVAPLVGVASATASQLLTAMEEKGRLERAMLPGDRRAPTG